LIKRRVAEEGVYLVDMYQVFQGHEAEYVSGDGLHLDPAGYQAMAQAFYDKILSIVPVTSFGPSLYSGGR
jgi:lysophospholipase L1-like esterase